MLGLLVLLLLVAVLALVALHPAIDAVELATSCLTILALAVSIALLRKARSRIVAAPLVAVSRAGPPTSRPLPLVPQLLAPLRL